MEQRKKHAVLWTLLLALGVGVRVFSAWCAAPNTDPDAGIVALMAKHIAEGRDFPVFFYGQAYMGSLEPAVSALFCWLFGVSGFSVCLGTAFFAVLLLPVVYAWAREVAGPTAGLWAMAFCVIGPAGFEPYMGMPRGGYAAVVFFGTTVLWLGGGLLRGESNGRSVVRVALLGLAAGLGWWCSQLIAASLLTVFVLLLLGLRGRLFAPRIALAGGLGFLLGSLPFWLWNLGHRWETFRFLDTFRPEDFLEDLRYCFFERLPMLMDTTPLPPPLGLLFWVLFAGLALVFLAETIRRLRRHDPSLPQWATVVVFLLFSVLLFATSRFARIHTSRYLLPLVPAFAVMLGAATARLAERWPMKLGYLPLAFLILCQAPALRDNIESRRQAIVHNNQAHKLAEYLRAHKLKTVIAGYRHDWMNFALGEEFVFCPLRNARYQPNIQQAELAEDVGVLDNHGGFVEFLAVSGGSMQTGKVAHGFVPPRGGWREIPLGLVRHSSESDGGGDVVVRDGHGGRVEALTDRDMDTGWNSQAAGKVEETLTIAFPSPIELSGMRLVNADLAYPPVIRLEGRQDTGSPWQILSTLDPVPGLFWSGPRPFWYGRFHRAECRFTPRQVSVVRVVVPPFKRAMQWDLKEIQLFAPAPASALWTPAGPGGPGASAGGYRTALPDLLRLLQERDIRHLYSDRWLANVVYSETGGRVATEREPGIFPEAGLSSSNIVRWSPDMALVCLESDAPCTREVLESRDIRMRETTVGHWVLFDFEPALKPGSAAESNRTSESAQWREEYRGNPGVYWAGFGCFQAQDKRWAVKLMRDAEIRRIDVGVNEEVLRLLDMAARAYPDSPQIRQRLAGYLRQAGRDEEARAIERASDVRWKPDIPALADFERGIRLLGISMEPRRVKAGEQVRIRYYWQCPLGWNDRPTAVFVHFMDASVRFQDDHPLLEGVNTDEQPLPETFVEERRLEVSRSAAPGATQIRLGLYRPQKGGRRHAVRTALPVERRAVLMPVSLDIGPAGPLPVPSRVER